MTIQNLTFWPKLHEHLVYDKHKLRKVLCKISKTEECVS